MRIRAAVSFTSLWIVVAAFSGGLAAQATARAGYWPESKSQEILAKTQRSGSPPICRH
jgi:hypothetical protein